MKYAVHLKPIGAIYRNKTLDTDKEEVEVTIDPASDDGGEHEGDGGEDWKLWTEF